MALDRVWTLHREDGTRVPVWGRVMLSSPLATVPPANDLGGGVVPPLSTVTVRMRYQALADVTVDSLVVDDAGGAWFVNETLEVGRRKWLDVGMSTYPPDVRPMPYTDVQPGWTLRVLDSYVRYLELANTSQVFSSSIDCFVTVPEGIRGGARHDWPYIVRLVHDDPDQRYIGMFVWRSPPALLSAEMRFQWLDGTNAGERTPGTLQGTGARGDGTTDLAAALTPIYGPAGTGLTGDVQDGSVPFLALDVWDGFQFELVNQSDIDAAGGFRWETPYDF